MEELRDVVVVDPQLPVVEEPWHLLDARHQVVQRNSVHLLTQGHLEDCTTMQGRQ